MTYLKFLSNSEIKLFESPPAFDSEDRKKYFTLSLWIGDILSTLRTTTNKIGFILLFGYFKATKKFFLPKNFYQKDIEYVVNRFNISGSIDFQAYKDATLLRHRNIILEKLGFKSFDKEAKEVLIEETNMLVSKQLKPKFIFLSLIDYLEINKIEIPTYNVLAETITNAINLYEMKLLSKLEKYLTVELIRMLDGLLEVDKQFQERYKLTLLKNIHHSTKPSRIKENIKNCLLS